MKLFKRLISVFLIISLVISLTGCNSGTKSDVIELTVYDQNSNFTGELTGWFADILKEKFNVKLNFVNSDNSYFDVNLVNADLGDLVIFSDDGSNFRDSMNSGILYDLYDDEFLSAYGSFYNNDKLSASFKRSVSLSENNSLFGVYTSCSPSSEGYSSIANTAYIRWDLYSQLGYPDISTLEDLSDVLKDMIELEPENEGGSANYGMTAFKDWDSTMPYLISSTAQLYGYESFGFGLYNLNTSEYEECLDDDGMYMRLLKFYNNLYREGLLDPDSMNQTQSTASDKLEDGKIMFGMTGLISEELYNTETNIEAGKELLPIAASDFKNYAYQNSIYGGDSIMCVGANSTYPDVCVEIIEWLYSTEGMLTMTYGPQEVIWDLDDDGVPYITDSGWNYLEDTTLEMPEGYNGTYAEGVSKLGISPWTINSEISGLDGITYDYSTWPSTAEHDSDEENVTDSVLEDWTSYTNSEDVDTYLANNDNLIIRKASDYSVTPVPTELIVYYNLISNSLCQYSWLAIYAETDEEFDSIIEEMKADIEAREYDAVMEYLNNEIQTRIEKESQID